MLSKIKDYFAKKLTEERKFLNLKVLSVELKYLKEIAVLSSKARINVVA